MKMANPGKDQIDAVWQFLHTLERIIEDGVLPGDEDTLNADRDPLIPEYTDAEKFDLIATQWKSVSHCWQRVLMAGQMCLENACDPSARTLEFKPEIARAIEEYPRLKAEHGELLAALQNLLMQIERAGGEPSFGVSHLREARTAISKAKGPTP